MSRRALIGVGFLLGQWSMVALDVLPGLIKAAVTRTRWVAL